MFKNLNAQSKTITGAAIILGAAALLSRVIGLIRDRILAHNFGAGEVLDAYYAAFKIPDLIFNLLIVGALTAGFIPIFTTLLSQEKKSEAWKMANNIFNILGISLVVLAFFGIIFAKQLTPLIAPGFSAVNQNLVTDLTRIMFLSPIFLGLSMTLGGILQSFRKFLIYSLSPIFYNIGIIIGATILTAPCGNLGLAVGVVLGAFLHFALQFYGAWTAGYRPQWILDFKDKNTRTVGKLMIPRTMGVAITQFNLVVVTILASWLPIGSVTIYNLAFNLQSVPIGIIGIPFALAAFPRLSEFAARRDDENFANTLTATVGKILFLITPVAIIFLLLRAQIVRVILGSGQFDWSATINTADTLAFFTFGLFAQALIPLLARAFYSLSDTKTPFLTGLFSELVSIIFALILMKPLGVAGLALAVSIGSIINMAALFIILKQKTHYLSTDKILSSLYKISIAGLLMAVVVQWIKTPLGNTFNLEYFIGIFGQGVIAGMVGISVYGLACHFFKLPEFINFKNSFERRWLKSRNLPSEEMGEF